MRRSGVDHVGVLVEDFGALDAIAPLLGLDAGPLERSEEHGVEVRWLVGGESPVEVLRPTDPDGRAGQALRRDGAGIHHLAVAVDDLDALIGELRAAGVAMLDEVPRMGTRDTRIAFLDPAATGGLRVELVEHPDRGQTDSENPL